MKQLKDIAIYVSDKIDTKSMNILDYISTDNMLPERGGIIPCATKPKASRVTQYLPGDVLVSNIRPYFKKIWFSNRIGGCSNDVIVFRVLDENKTYPKYLYYLLSQDIFFDYMMSGSNGTKMPRGNKKLIPEFTFNDVDIEKQKRIADILSAYDNLIENNQKQIKLLEEVAMRLYKEWFVKLRFPGYETTKIVDGVPEGWEKCNLGLYAKVKSGYAFKSSWWKHNGVPVIKIKDIQDNTVNLSQLDCVDISNANKAIDFKVVAGDLLIAMTGATTGKIAIVPIADDMLVNQRVGKFFLGENPIAKLPFLYSTLQEANSHNWALNFANGSAPAKIAALFSLNALEKSSIKGFRFCNPIHPFLLNFDFRVSVNTSFI
jgi:type I restriction enzyme S subunit